MDLARFYRKSAACFEGYLFRFCPEFVTNSLEFAPNLLQKFPKFTPNLLQKTKVMIFTRKIESDLLVWKRKVPKPLIGPCFGCAKMPKAMQK